MLVEQQWPSSDEQQAGLMSTHTEGELLERYAYLVKRAASHMRTQLGVVVDMDDIQQIGLVALLSSIRRYGRNVDEQFSAFAFKRIRGAMLDEFRRIDWRGRQLRQQSHQLRDASRKLLKQLGREPSDSELCQALDIDLDQLLKLHYASQAEAIDSLEALLGHDDSFTDAGSQLSHTETALMLQKALTSLPERNKLLLHLYYSHEMNMKEIALALDLTEARVCQLHKLAIESLTRKLQQSE
tara:strand:- start:4723 stop:5445 length:723 start_codon:yes stop_codon:yes gene_type:complete